MVSNEGGVSWPHLVVAVVSAEAHLSWEGCAGWLADASSREAAAKWCEEAHEVSRRLRAPPPL